MKPQILITVGLVLVAGSYAIGHSIGQVTERKNQIAFYSEEIAAINRVDKFRRDQLLKDYDDNQNTLYLVLKELADCKNRKPGLRIEIDKGVRFEYIGPHSLILNTTNGYCFIVTSDFTLEHEETFRGLCPPILMNNDHISN